MGRMNYIQNMEKQFGENWIVSLRPEDIQRSGKRIFKEMVRGNIDYQQHGKYFLDPKFLDNLIIAARNELEVNCLLYNAVNFYKMYYPEVPNISLQLNHLQVLCTVYNTLLDKLSIVRNTGNIGWLADTSGLLHQYRNHLN